MPMYQPPGPRRVGDLKFDVGGGGQVLGGGGGLVCGGVTTEKLDLKKMIEELDLSSESKTSLMQPAKISLMVDMLNEGSIETKINCTKLIDVLMEGKDLESEFTSSLSLVVGLLRLVKDKRHSKRVLPGLSLLKTICSHESVRSSVVSVGTVPQVVELLPSLNHECLELALHILEVLSI
ncbi:U-box domain-containing protein 30-like [Rosa rugosa]|uniref:U-box domain-containing protein 30-like n=1 Tax=Rosa rugosa TaxID=74645 RepID=UPI002B417F06|nr:U-box domain-containing protein 30-like [Rosa rugosa]